MLNAYGAYYHMPVQNGMGRPTLDIIGCHCGRFFAIETKAKGKVPTPRQAQTINAIACAQGSVFVIDGPGEDFKLLHKWLQYYTDKCITSPAALAAIKSITQDPL